MRKSEIINLNTVFGIVNARGEVVCDDSIRTKNYEKVEDFIEASCMCLRHLIERVGGISQIKAMGIGAPNGNFYNGTIEKAPNLPWKGIVPMAELFSKELGIPVALTNDANAAAIGEMTYGVARGMKNFIVITLGTGVGSGIVINGQMVYGCDGFAGELGHVTVVRGEQGRLCGCGRRGCLEAYCSATGVVRTAQEYLLSMSLLPPARAMILPRKFLNLQEKCWVRLVLISLLFVVQRHSYSLAVSPRAVIL